MKKKLSLSGSAVGLSGSRRPFAAGLTAVALALGLSASQAYGQCGGTITVADDPNIAVLVVGQDLEIVVQFGPLGESATVDSFTVSLDCELLETLACGTACTDDDLALLYLGDATIADYTCAPFGAVGIESDQPGGFSIADNSVTFTFVDALGDPDPIELPSGDMCGFRFGVRVNDFSSDTSPNRITGKGETMGHCLGGDPFSLCGSYSIFLAEPQIHIEKTVTPLEECENSGNSVTYNYAVTNTGDVPLSNIIVVDDNGTPPTPPAVPAVGDDFNPDPVDVLPGPPDGFNDGDTNEDNILNLTETWLYTSTRTVASLPVGDTTNTAVVNGDFVNAVGTTTVTDDDDAIVTINPSPSCLITPSDGVCETTLTASTDGCDPTFEWFLDGVHFADGAVIVLDANSAAGEYCVEVTDCNGCTSGGPESDCCFDFTPPVPPPCTITGDTEICSGDAAVEWCAPDVAGATYDWTGPGFAAGNEDPRCISVSVAGEYCVTVTDADGCTCEDCETLVVNDCGGEACSPGYWKQDQHFAAWCEANFNPTADFCFAGPATLFKTAFGMTNADFVVPLPGGFNPDTLTLLDAVRNRLQGCNKQILFQGVAALLNAAAIPSFGHTVAEVQDVMKDAFAGTITFCEAHQIFSGWTNTAEAAGGCPCNNDGCHFDDAAAVASTESPAPDVQSADAVPAAGSNSNAWCGVGAASMMPFSLVGLTLIRRRRSGSRRI